MYLTSTPPLSCSVLLHRDAAVAKADDGLGPALFCNSGRTALAIAARLLRLEPQSNIVVPALNCQAVVDTWLRAGARLRYYDVPETLESPLEAVQAAVNDRTAAVCAIHYFGLAADLGPLRRFCDSREIPLIEDCAQALYSGGAGGRCGALGDMAVFSLRKTLPIPNGGAIVANRPGWRRALAEIVLKKPSPLDTLARTAFLLLKYHCMDYGRALAAAKRLYLRCFPLATALGGDAPVASPEAIAPLSQRIFAAADPAAIRAARQTRYRFWAEALLGRRGLQILRPVLAPAAAPYSFPVLIERREEVLDELCRAGISLEATFSGAPFLRPECTPAWRGRSSAESLARKLVSLPVHQALPLPRLARIASKFIAALERRH